MLPKLGRYETLKKIASGGMATVYLGRVVGEGGFERLVALKVMHPHIASDPDFVGMFLDEARLAAKIRHPNVVATIDIQKTNDAMFLVMDYVDGPTLQQMRKHLKSREERLPIGICLRFFIDILNGLQEAHDLRDKEGKLLNLVHRDVSPHNILIGQDGRAQLTDFGVAKAEARISSTRGGQLKGKIAYMPPEQIIAQPVDRRADVYSAGVCLWEAFVGKRLFRAANDGALVHMILEGAQTPPSKYCDDIPAAIEGVLMKAISRKAEDRYDEAVDFAEALEDAARESNLKIPRQRAVGKFIKEIVAEIGRMPVSKRSLTPPSAPSKSSEVSVPNPSLPSAVSAPGRPSSPSQVSSPSLASAPSMPSLATGPRLPKPPTPAPPIRSASAVLGTPVGGPGPPPIPDIGTDPAIAARKLPKPASRPPAPPPKPRPAAGAAPSRASSPQVAPQAQATNVVVPRPVPKMYDDIEDPPTEVMSPDQAMIDLVNNSQPSVVTSPTQTDAVYSLVPPPNRHGLVAVTVAGVFLMGILIAIFVGGSPDDDTNQIGDPAAPLPDFDKTTRPEPKPVAPTPDPSPEPSVSPSATSSAGDDTKLKPIPIIIPRGKKKRKGTSDPKPGQPFKPKTL